MNALCAQGPSAGLGPSQWVLQETEGLSRPCEADPALLGRWEDPVGDAGAKLPAPEAASRGQHRLHHKGCTPGLPGGEPTPAPPPHGPCSTGGEGAVGRSRWVLIGALAPAAPARGRAPLPAPPEAVPRGPPEYQLSALSVTVAGLVCVTGIVFFSCLYYKGRECSQTHAHFSACSLLSRYLHSLFLNSFYGFST